MIRFLFMGLLVFGFCCTSHSATYYQLQGAFRSFPRSASAEAHAYYNEKLWSADSNEQPWKYGFWRAGAFVGIHGMAGVKIDVFPISIWQLTLQRTLTSRFYDTQTLDCTVIQCRGSLQRGIFKTSLALGYGEFFAVPSYTVTDLSLDSNEKDFSSEEDNLVADRSGDQLTISQLAVGFKNGAQRWVIVSKASQMKLTKDHNNSQYLVWSQTIDSEKNYFVGAGSYSSNHVKRGFSMVAGINWTVGENLSLF